VSAAEKLATLLLWLVVLVPPLYFSPSAKESFRLPKLMIAEWLGLASLVPLAWALRRVETVRWRDLWDLPALRAALPLAAVATLGLATSSHPLHVRQALADLWIGAACLVGWSAALPAARLERLLGGLLWPAAVLAGLGILQFHGVQPLPLGGVRGARLTITSLAGNPGDLGAFLVLPCLIAQWRLARGWRRMNEEAASPPSAGRRREGPRRGRGQLWLVAAFALCAWAMALTQTFAALAALLLGSLAFWALALAGRRDAGSGAGGGARAGARWLAAAALAVAVLAAGAAAAAVPAIRARVIEKVNAVRHGDWNSLLTGRLDGWRAALWMLGRHPWAGVGHGAYRAEFAPAKLALVEGGVAFLSGQQQHFANAHDEPLEVAADCGVPGLLALAWALAVLAMAVRTRALPPRPEAGSGGSSAEDSRRRERSEVRGGGSAARWPRHADGAFVAGGLVALGLLSLVDFPFRIALVAFPALLFLAWVLRPAAAEAAA
jgi:O-antigen ligase